MSKTNLILNDELSSQNFEEPSPTREERSISGNNLNNYGTISPHHSDHSIEVTESDDSRHGLPDFSTTLSKLKYGGKTSVAGAIFITMNAIIGSAFLNLPFATKVFSDRMLLLGQLPIVLVSECFAYFFLIFYFWYLVNHAKGYVSYG